jgi:3-hydroxybutyrate dehydrogenase
VAAKHGLVGFTKSAALECATTGITVNAICPGWVLTPLVQKQVDARAAAQGIDNDEAKRQLLAEKQPSLQFTTPEQLGDLAVFPVLARRRQRARRGLRGVAWASTAAGLAGSRSAAAMGRRPCGTSARGRARLGR